MNTMRTKLSAVAAAVSLACAGTALAQSAEEYQAEDKMDSEYSNQQQYETQTKDKYETESTEQYGAQSQPSITPQPDIQPDVQPNGQPSIQPNGQPAASMQDDFEMKAETRPHVETGEKGLIDDTAIEENKLTKFTAAVEKAGLTEALSSGNEYTVFAPTDEAFDALDDERAEELMSEENVEELREVLRSHIIVGKVDATTAKTLQKARVLTGDTIELSTDNEELHVANATVVNTDISNGNLTIHTIDSIIDSNSLMSDADREEEESE